MNKCFVRSCVIRPHSLLLSCILLWWLRPNRAAGDNVDGFDNNTSHGNDL